MSDVVVLEITCLFRCKFCRHSIDRAGIQHQSAYSLYRQLRSQIFCTFGDRPSPVFVYIKFAVLVKVLERKSVDIQYDDPGSLAVAEFGPTRL